MEFPHSQIRQFLNSLKRMVVALEKCATGMNRLSQELAATRETLEKLREEQTKEE